MVLNNWNDCASLLAMTARSHYSQAQRGVLSINSPGGVAAVAGVFGNDNYALDERARREVDLVRQRLEEAAVEELGFGLSPDGYTWALLVKVDNWQYRTPAGQVFRLEMVKSLLDDVVQEAWCEACAVLSAVPSA